MLKYVCSLVMQLALKSYDTSFELRALARETGKLNHTQLLSKEDGGDGTRIKMQVYILSNDVHVCSETPYTSEI